MLAPLWRMVTVTPGAPSALAWVLPSEAGRPLAATPGAMSKESLSDEPEWEGSAGGGVASGGGGIRTHETAPHRPAVFKPASLRARNGLNKPTFRPVRVSAGQWMGQWGRRLRLT